MEASTPPPASSSSGAFDDCTLIKRKPMTDDAAFDITAMVDLVFMMNIYFLVAWIVAATAEIDLPAAKHCIAADAEKAVVITITAGQSPSVYLGDVKTGGAIDPYEVEWRLKKAAEEGKNAGKAIVLVKAEKQVRLRDLVRISAAATSVKGMKLNLAVIEKN